MFNYGHIYLYLVESISSFGIGNESDDEDGDLGSGFTSTTKPLRKGINLVKAEFVENIHDNMTNDTYYLRAHVHHSMKSDPPLNVVIAISCISGSIKFGRCSCRASALGRCSHIAALLLHLNEFVTANGYDIDTPSTSKPCSWNTGKKRKKDPKAVYESVCKSFKFSNDRIISWDPRPAKFQGTVGKQETNMFLRDLSKISCKSNEISMWELSLKIQYDDFTLTEERKQTLHNLTTLLEQSLSGFNENEPKELEGTRSQIMSHKWVSERQFRITASRCKQVFTFGKELIAGHSHKIVCSMYKWMRNNFWFPTTLETKYIRYGIEEEPKARSAYVRATGNRVTETGLWVNGAFPYLGASPDGLILDEDSKATGIIEIKCLKVLKEMSVDELIEHIKQNKVSSTLLGRQCFTVVGESLILKECHMYYYQVQLQLLITELPFCDFILHSPKGPPSIQRIVPDTCIQHQIKKNLSVFWHKVFIPEYFEMRVPRRLQPFVL